MSVKTIRTLGAAGAALGALLAVGAGPALAAPSTTVTPASHNFTLGTSSVSAGVPTALANGTCTMNGGAATVPAAPANHNAAGPVTVNFTTRPTFSACTSLGVPFTVTTAGTWSLSFQSGSPNTATINIPSSPVAGITVSMFGCTGRNASPTSLSGNWTNGTVAPLVKSTVGMGGSLPLTWTGGSCTWGAPNPFVVSGGSFTVTDTTNAANVILVGP